MSAPPFRLLAITPPEGSVDRSIVGAWETARGVGLAVLLREPGTPASALLDPAHRLTPLRHACVAAGIPCLLSVDSGDLEPPLARALLSSQVIGVQLRGDPSPATIAAARRTLGPSAVLGRSCHGQPGAASVDYSVLAPIFPPRTHAPGGPHKVAVGLAPLQKFAQAEPHVFALGGVTASTADACLAAGAFGLAAIRTFFGPKGEVTDNVARVAELVAARRPHALAPRRS